jgi:hypothetical protein
MDPNVVLSRLKRLIQLDTTVFDEVRDDSQELIPALIVAGASSLLAGLGAWLYWLVVPSFDFDSAFLNSIVLGSVFLFVMYGVAAIVIYLVLVQAYRVQVDLQSLIRTMGYASFPLAISVLMFIPIVYPLFAILPTAMLLVMVIYAVQSAASGADSKQVVVSSTIGIGVMILVLGVIAISSSGSGDAAIGAGQFGLIFDFS